MHLEHLRLRDFRNYARLDADFAPGFHLLLGTNAQGKTNILEAIYLLSTLRSFRGVGGAQMIRHGQPGYFVGGRVISQGAHEIKIVKGTGRVRRRFLDLLLSQTHPTYLPLLQRYTRALRSRNALLKQHLLDEVALDGFTAELVEAGRELMRLRTEMVPRVSPLARLAYRRISHEAEELRFEYQSSVKEDFTVELAQSRRREKAYRATLIGPHRDEVQLLLNEKSAAQFGSEGQKRTIALALKMAQAEYLSGIHGSPPLLLIDDVMGELDAKRRGGFLPLLERCHRAGGQAFMTATEENWPAELGTRLQRWRIESGAVDRL